MSKRAFLSKKYEVDDFYQAIEMYFEKGWTDGLPIVPPVEAKVRQFIEYSGKDPSEILCELPERRRIITIEKVAINAVMAGCLPQYMPVILTAMEAMCEEPYNLHGSSASTGGAATLLIVNGPIVSKLGINSGIDLFGPGCRANATIGRALRLMLINVCGAIPGILDMSAMGHPGKYTYCIAENEVESPWEPYHVEKGFDGGTSTVTVLPALSPHRVDDHISNSAENILTSIASVMMRLCNYRQGNNYGLKFCVVIVGHEHMQVIKKNGWTKKEAKIFLHQCATRSVADLKRWGMMSGAVDARDETETVTAVKSAEDIILIVAGGSGGFSACIAPWAYGISCAPVIRPILPGLSKML